MNTTIIVEPDICSMNLAGFLCWIKDQVDSGNGILEAPPGLTSVGLSRIKLALDLHKRPDILFRALVEDWGYQDIILALY